MRAIPARFLGVFLLLVFLGATVGGYYYYHNFRMDAEKIVERALRNGQRLKSYYGSLEMSTTRDEAAQRYFVQIWFSAPARYRVEVFTSYVGEGPPSQVFISDGKERWVYSPEVGDFYLLNPLSAGEASSSPFLLAAFLEELDRARDVELLGMEKTERGNYYLLKVIPQKTARGHAWEKVWLEKRSLLPVKFQLYDEQDRLYRTITFKKIDLNPKLTDELFRIGFALQALPFILPV
ncbi:MAG: outer membrane lipoprotein-sorting protein [Bacillota bacterium]